MNVAAPCGVRDSPKPAQAVLDTWQSGNLTCSLIASSSSSVFAESRCSFAFAHHTLAQGPTTKSRGQYMFMYMHT